MYNFEYSEKDTPSPQRGQLTYPYCKQNYNVHQETAIVGNIWLLFILQGYSGLELPKIIIVYIMMF